MTTTTQANHYEILHLPAPQPNTKPPSDQDIKTAYRAALLQHHPDKSPLATSQVSSPSIDAIKLAYATLSSPTLRAEYDRSLLLTLHKESTRSHHTGEEVVDLDDLTYEEGEGKWYRGCRCGEERGFVVTEGELEDAEGKGEREVVVGCAGCSLVLRVGFGVVEEGEGGQAQVLEGSSGSEVQRENRA